jgi:hypothetical protein
MRTARPTPLPGLLIGLIALVVFASAAVALAARGSSAGGVASAAATRRDDGFVSTRDDGDRDGGRGGFGRGR